MNTNLRSGRGNALLRFVSRGNRAVTTLKIDQSFARPMPAADFLPWLKQVEGRREPAKTAIQTLDTQLNPIHCTV